VIDTAEYNRVLIERNELAAEVRQLREALDIIAKCPAEAVHLMPLAAQAALTGGADK
jgi:hypothetical protein